MAIDVKRVKKTRGGYDVRIYATDGGATGDRIHGDVRTSVATGWQMMFWFADGHMYESGQEHPFDLVEESETIEISLWLNVYRDGSASSWRTKAGANEASIGDRVACINIKRTVTKGEGL